MKNIVLFLSKTSAVSAEGGFDIVLRTPHPAGGSPVSIFKIQNRLNLPPNTIEASGTLPPQAGPTLSDHALRSWSSKDKINWARGLSAAH